MQKKYFALTIGGAALLLTGITWYSGVIPAFSQGKAMQCMAENNDLVWIEGGSFIMGEDKTYPEERLEHKVTVDGFWIDRHEVTNKQFAKFVAETGYITVAERQPDTSLLPPNAPSALFKPGSAQIKPPAPGGKVENWWVYTPGANWRHPEGPGSNIDGMENFPVVQIAFEDAQAYAKWAGRELPTEAQYEFAARSGKEQERYAWGGDEIAPGGVHKANIWQGTFPIKNEKSDGYEGLAPVGCFDANDYGVYDMIGNAWEWTSDWYAPRHNAGDNFNPKGPAQEDSYDKNNEGFPVRVIKGGSFLCAPNYCMRYRPSARHAQDTGLGANHIGFRTVLNERKEQ